MLSPATRPMRGARSTILQTIANRAPVSRADLSRITDLSKQTTSEVVARLEADGWVQPVGQSTGHLGRRAATYEIPAGTALLASADLGGTKLHIRLFDLAGQVVNEARIPTSQDGGAALIDQIATCLAASIQQVGFEPHALLLLCIGVPGVPDLPSGQILLAPNIAGLEGFDFIGGLRRRLGIDILVENDVNLAAIGESQTGEGADPLVYLSIGTGIGAGIVCDKKILRGAHGAAGEVAFLPLGADPFDPESRRSGALERVAAGQALRALYAARSQRTRDVPEIFDAAEADEAGAVAAIDAFARHIALGIAAVSAIVDPGCVVLGGSIGARQILCTRIIHHLASCSPRPAPVRLSAQGQNAPLLGGQFLALEHFFTGTLHLNPAPAQRADASHEKAPS